MGPETLHGHLIWFDEARNVLYFSLNHEDYRFDEDAGVFVDGDGAEISTDEIEVAAILDQALADRVTSHEDVHGITGSFVRFDGFNEEIEYRLVAID